MLLNLIFAPNTEPAIEAVREAVPDTFANDPRLNADQSMGLWALPSAMLSDGQRASLFMAGAQLLDYDTDVGGDWKSKVVPVWVDPVEE
jgi:hypothetical protein